MKTPPFENPWEKRLHDELRKLPELEAPASLIPSVMAMISKQPSLAWYRRPATTWPPALRIALVVSSVCLFGLLFLAAQQFFAGSPETTFFTTLMAKGGTLFRTMETLLGACAAVMRQYAGPVMFGVIAVAGFAYFSLLGLGGALWRVASQNHSSP
jgi:hypothetical protein